MTEDAGYAYIKPVLDEMGVPYDVLNSATQDLTAAMLASTARRGPAAWLPKQVAWATITALS